VAYERAIALKPDYAAAHNNLGVALKHLGRTDDAVAAFDRALDGVRRHGR
jgi:Tfp pilus assembly protein PilF